MISNARSKWRAPYEISLVVALGVAMAAMSLVSGQRNEASEMAEDCEQGAQYFQTSEARCRNCSEALRLFEPSAYPPSPLEWQPATGNSEVATGVSDKSPAISAEQQQQQQQQQQRRTSLISSLIGSSRLTPLPPRGGSGAPPGSAGRRGSLAGGPAGRSQADAILSRLVLAAAPRDTPTEEDAEEAQDQAQAAAAGAGGQGSRPQIGSPPRSSQLGEADQLARQWQRLLTGFVRSRELASAGLLEAVAACRQADSTASAPAAAACQMWANACVLAMYAHSPTAPDTPTAGPPALSAARSRGVPPATSWQQCPRFGLGSICNGWREWQRAGERAAADTANIYHSHPGGGSGGGADADGQEGQQVGVDGVAGGVAGFGPGGVPAGVPFKLDQLLQLLAYEYALDGRLLRVAQFDLRDLAKFCLFARDSRSSSSSSACGESPLSATRSQAHDNEEQATKSSNNNNGNANQLDEIRVGASASLVCRFSDLQARLAAPSHLNETKFLDLFIGYQLGGATFVRPVPILLKNFLSLSSQGQASLPNVRHARDPSRWRLVHRYFPLASVRLESGTLNALANSHNTTTSTSSSRRSAAATSNNEDHQEENEQQALIYARDAHLEVKFQRGQGASLAVHSMLLHLDYDFLPLVASEEKYPQQQQQESELTRELTIRIRLTQSQLDMPAHLKDLDLVLAIVGLASCICSLIKCYNIQRYQGLVKLDIHSLGLFLVLACDLIANLIALATCLFAAHLFASVKLSPGAGATARWWLWWWPIMLPPDAGDATERELLAKLKLALALKLVGLLYKLRLRLRVDLFLIDWERPKMLTSNQLMGHHLHQQQQQQNKQQVGVDYTRQQQQQQQQISFWRPYTIANRWLQLQTTRRQSLALQLVALVCAWHWLGLQRLASSDVTKEHHGGRRPQNPWEPQLAPNHSHLFRALLVSLLYLVLATVQIAYQRFVHEPMVRCLMREFADLCSVANVSLFALLHPRFGFYLHGRNANGAAELGIAEMNVLLEREARDLCSKRGLLPNSDHQTFTMLLPRLLHDHYRNLLFRHEFGAPLTPHSAHLNSNKLLAAAAAPGTLLQSALNLTQLNHQQQRQQQHGHSSGGANIESVAARNKAINVFLVNFLEHSYADIDYAVRERRRFEGLLELELLEEEPQNSPLGVAERKVPLPAQGFMSTVLGGGGGGGAGVQGPGSEVASATNGQKAATLFVDREDSFARLLWRGLEWDLLLVELLVLLHLDLLLLPLLPMGAHDQWETRMFTSTGGASLTLAASLVWLANRLLRWLYATLARKNLVTKAMLDEKFLIR